MCIWAAPVAAQVDLGQANACFDAAMRDQTTPSACIEAAQDTCMDNAQETPAVATLCFVAARESWSEGLASIFAETVGEMDEVSATVAQIETKYDLLANLLQCDRFEELSIAASDLGGDMIALQTARCQASASAVIYMRLYLTAQAQGTD
jgi:hypothetical protein